MDLPYSDPEWGHVPFKDNYYFEILKNGVIIEEIKLNVGKSFIVIGRNPNTDIQLFHNSISRYHAIIQNCPNTFENKAKGCYIYDLGSTHGTIVNKVKITPRKYYLLQPGFVIKFGESSRLFIFNDKNAATDDSPPQIVPKDSPLLKKDKDDGVNWGIKDELLDNDDNDIDGSASELVDENNFVNDPKKYLKNNFENHGEEFEFDIQEVNAGTPKKRFNCSLVLPLENLNAGSDRTVDATCASKREAIVNCCLASCRLLNSMGLLKHPNKYAHTSRKRLKARKIVGNDYYESDEDEFTDRTGALDRKRRLRQHRMMVQEDLKDLKEFSEGTGESQVVHTYESLKIKLENIDVEMRKVEEELAAKTAGSGMYNTKEISKVQIPDHSQNDAEMDPLDSYMTTLDKEIATFFTKTSNKNLNAASYKILMDLRLKMKSLTKERDELNTLLKYAEPAPNVKKMFYHKKEEEEVVDEKSNQNLDSSQNDPPFEDATKLESLKESSQVETKVTSVKDVFVVPKPPKIHSRSLAREPATGKLIAVEKENVQKENKEEKGKTKKIYGCVWKPEVLNEETEASEIETTDENP